MVNTAAEDFRELHFRSGAEVMAEARKIINAEEGGTLRRTGNWTVGQTLGHLAVWMEYALDGYPKTMRPPWFVKAVVRIVMKKRMIKGPMRRGVKIPGVKGGTLGTDVMPTQEGYQRLERAWERLTSTDPARVNPLLGKLTHEEWIALNLRHAELHLGFLKP